ncbi:MAG: type II toxin-antitoxin system VapC family toxin [Acidobacteria bacterium]|nr:type II toxin-antitoxin system VapC family toxin [Acidobacteriota bacterium]
MNTSGRSGERIARLVLDTSAYSKLRSGDTRVRDLIADAESVMLPAPVLGELHGAFELGSRTRENRVALSDFLAEPFVGTLPVTETVARHYGRVFAGLRRAGTPIPANDMWIAACAIDQGACLLTFDHDFEKIAGLDRIILDGIELGTDADPTLD